MQYCGKGRVENDSALIFWKSSLCLLSFRNLQLPGLPYNEDLWVEALSWHRDRQGLGKKGVLPESVI